MWINHKNRTFSRLLSQPWNASVSPFGLFYRPKWQISLPFHVLQLVKSLPGASPYRLLIGCAPRALKAVFNRANLYRKGGLNVVYYLDKILCGPHFDVWTYSRQHGIYSFYQKLIVSGFIQYAEKYKRRTYLVPHFQVIKNSFLSRFLRYSGNVMG